MIADNKIAELAGWDERTLASEISGLIEISEEFEIEDTGFDTGEIDLILDGGVTLNEPSTVLDLTGPVPVVLREGKGRVEGVVA